MHNGLPQKLNIANLPTKIEKLINTSSKYDKNIYIKRDDYTGIEISGNKVRKLEFAVKEALDMGATTLITCGGIQSNHARATAAVAKMYGLECSLVLSSLSSPPLEGNYLLDILLGADITLVAPEEFKSGGIPQMTEIADDLSKIGKKGYIIPMGASFGIGNFGYLNAIDEIVKQESEMGIIFDAIVCAIGSGGTYTGLYLGNEFFNLRKDIIGINVCKSVDFFTEEITKIGIESKKIAPALNDVTFDNIRIYDGYVGRGYALNTDEDFKIIKEIAHTDGIILDPVYTGKAMKGLLSEINKGTFDKYKNILFIHTGGIFGVFPKSDEMFA